VANIYDISVLNAATGSYTVTYSATSANNTLTITKGTVSESVDLATAGGTVNFSTLGVSFKLTPAAAASASIQDTVGADLDTAELTVNAGSTAQFQVGYSEGAYDRIGVTISSVKSSDLALAAGDISTSAGAQSILDDIESAISTVSTARGEIGAYQNRLGYAADNLAISVENFQSAESVIRDVDMAQEMTTFTKNQILLQAGTAMLAQANLAPTQVLTLFR
jgi:flagellin